MKMLAGLSLAHRVGLVVFVGGMLTAASALSGVGPAFNATPSISKGFYWRTPVAAGDTLTHGDIVCHHWQRPGWTQGRADYPPDGIALCKRVALVAGEAVVVIEDAHGIRLEMPKQGESAYIRARDSHGRPMPNALAGLSAVPAGHVVLLGDHPNSLDDRYLGPTVRKRITSRLRPLWTWGPDFRRSKQ